ncbi:MAG TPA: BON domain-containing protein [Candidatus Methylomirabilis sp.]|nr:BON domain-containing protein [Candidatus Methylomirabilis sp.]
MTNIKIIDEIRAKLEDNHHIPHPAEIAISEREGDVTLRGSVGSWHQRQTAVQVAKSVRGVREVEDQLTVDVRDHWDDDVIRGVALQALISSDDVPADRVDVKVDAGWLTLKGEVKHQFDSDAAFAAVSGVPGIGGITNEIKVITAGIDG